MGFQVRPKGVSVRPLVLLVGVLLALALHGCASRPFEPLQHRLDYRERATSRAEGGVRVSASVLSAEESLDVYGFPLAEKGIQPV